MKRTRRLAAFFAAIVLGIGAWFVLLICYPTKGELTLSRELGSGSLISRIPDAAPRLFGRIVFGPPRLTARFSQPATGTSGQLPMGIVTEKAKERGELILEIHLDASDKSWDLEVTEKRTVHLRFGKKLWPIGTKTRVFRTDRLTARF